jgi:hypothetical protein
MSVLVFAMLCAIIITRLHAMYQGSRRILIFLIVTFLAINIYNGVGAIMITMYTSGEEFIIDGTYQCSFNFTKDLILMISTNLILSIVWQVIALFLAAWIAFKHFRALRRHSVGGIMGDFFTVLIKTHVLYFVCSVTVSSLGLAVLYPPILTGQSLQTYYGLLQILEVVQLSLLGPRLILGVREYSANLKAVAHSNAATAMTSIAFQERVHISTGNGV